MPLFHISERNYCYTYFELNINNIRKICEDTNLLYTNDSVTSDLTKTPDILNKQFASTGQTLASKIAHSEELLRYLPTLSFSESFAVNPVLRGEREVEIKSLPLNKAPGLYSCPVKILKSAGQLLSKPLASIKNKSIESGIYLSKLKVAEVVKV